MASDGTIDCFHRGRFFVAQPLGKGHRSGMDAMVLAAAVPSGFDGLLGDFGAGAGAAGLAVASRCQDATIVLVEREEEMVGFAQTTIDLEKNASLRRRIKVLQADVALAGKVRISAGLSDNMFDFVIMNPPFNEPSDRKTPDSLREAAHVMADDLMEHWLRSAAAVMRPGGMMALIARPHTLTDILPALSGRFGSAQIVPVHPRKDAPAIRVILRAKYGSRARLDFLPPLILHDGSGDFSRHADALINGEASLFGD